jgi:hypothetical protein
MGTDTPTDPVMARKIRKLLSLNRGCPCERVMDVVGIGRRESRRAAALQYPRATVPARVLFSSARGKGAAARAVRGAGNAGRGASLTAGKREGFSF